MIQNIPNFVVGLTIGVSIGMVLAGIFYLIGQKIEAKYISNEKKMIERLKKYMEDKE